MVMDCPKEKKGRFLLGEIDLLINKPVEYQLQLMVKIVNKQQPMMDNEFDWIQQHLYLLYYIDKVLQMIVDKNFSSLHYMVKEQVITLFVIVFLVYDILLVDFETKPIQSRSILFNNDKCLVHALSIVNARANR
jgi:hypothetical protein